MKYDALVMVNNQNRETRRKMEERKIMDKEEVKRWEEENVESEESYKNNIPGNNDSTGSVRSD